MEDLLGAGYHIGQSKLLSGRVLSGKGYLNGTQTKLKYARTRYWLYILHHWKNKALLCKCSNILFSYLYGGLYSLPNGKTVFGRVYGYESCEHLCLSLNCKLGMVLGLTPVIGIPTVFSYGGSFCGALLYYCSYFWGLISRESLLAEKPVSLNKYPSMKNIYYHIVTLCISTQKLGASEWCYVTLETPIPISEWYYVAPHVLFRNQNDYM